MAGIDRVRGDHSRSDFVRGLLQVAVAAATVTQQDAPSAPIGADPLPPVPVKESIVLPPVGKADASGMHYRWDPRSATVGTLQFAKAGEEWRELDLIGVELQSRPDGTTVLYYADRSRVRTAPNEDRGMVRESGRGDLERQRKIDAALWPGTEDMGR